MCTVMIIFCICAILYIGATNPAKKRKKHNKGCPESPPLPLTAAAAAVGSFPLPLLPPLSSLPTQLNRVKDVQPDEDGYYTFTVSMV